MKIVLDANIYVSSLINTLGSSKKIIELWEQGDFELLTSAPIIEEIGRVLRYPRIIKRHKLEEQEIQEFLRLLSRRTTSIRPLSTVDAVKVDKSDNRYLECAVAGRAKYVVSGDRHLLDIGMYQGIVILPPASFVALLEKRNL